MRKPSTPLPWATSDSDPEFVFHDNFGMIDVDQTVAHCGSVDDAEFIVDATRMLAQVLEEIKDLHDAFGAPGDYGYSTAKGEALFALYKSGNEIEQTLACVMEG